VRPDVRYTLHYDKLVIGVGAVNNTFRVPGVEQHAFFLKARHEAWALGEHTVGYYIVKCFFFFLTFLFFVFNS
jgi:NADH dehydrogenase FAD-containing subunit